ncbi:MAG: HupE/UreJ family protein [Roseibium sp.]
MINLKKTIARRMFEKPSARLFALCVLLPATLLVSSLPAPAHFLLNLNVRIFHIERTADGLELHVRMPMPYLVAGLVGSEQDDGLPEPAPFTVNRKEEGKLVHLVDLEAFLKDQNGLGQIAADGLLVHAVSDTDPLVSEVLETRLYRIGTQPPFATLDEAKAAFKTNPTVDLSSSQLFVGDAMVDVKLKLQSNSAISQYQLSSSLDPELPDQDKTANLILDYGPGGTKVFRSQGLLEEPVTISRSSFSAIITFIKEGIRHILEGLDHVLFVLCLVIGAKTLSSLAWRVTGFTVGHSITLTAGFFGFVPKGAWFIPAVETTIALSIIYAAAIAVWPRSNKAPSERSMVLVTGVIGLLHGLGFSFVLKNILQVTSPNIWQSLLAFNVGVEIGQLAIVVLVWPALWLITRKSAGSATVIRAAIAAGCTAIALFWTIERVGGVITAL